MLRFWLRPPRYEVGSRPLQRVLRTSTVRRSWSMAVTSVPSSYSNDISSVVNRTSAAPSSPRPVPEDQGLLQLVWSIAPNDKGLAAGSWSDELYLLPPRRFRRIIPRRLGSRRLRDPHFALAFCRRFLLIFF
jgi:hypothetical protein